MGLIGIILLIGSYGEEDSSGVWGLIGSIIWTFGWGYIAFTGRRSPL
jgi:hypothetical protein